MRIAPRPIIVALLGLILSAHRTWGLSRPLRLEVWDYPRIPDAVDPHDRFAWLHTLARHFEDLHPDVRVDITELTWQHGEEKLKVAALAGAPPDLSSGPIPIAFVQRGLIRPIDDCLTAWDRADLLPAALAGYTAQGHVWGFPWCLTGNVMLLNLDLFRAAGCRPPPDGRWTPETMVATARVLTGRGRWGLGFALEPGRNAEYGLLMMDGGTPLEIDAHGGPPSIAFDRPAMVRSIESIDAWVKPGGIASPECAGFQEKDLWEAFLERQTVAIAPMGVWAVGALERKATFKWGLAHFPARPGNPSGGMVAVSGYFVFRHADARRETMALDLARFITNPANLRLLKTYRQFPARRSVGDLYADDPPMQRASEIIDQGVPTPIDPDWPSIDERFLRGLQGLFQSHACGPAALAKLAKEARGLIHTPTNGAVVPSAAAAGYLSPAGGVREATDGRWPPEAILLALLAAAFAIGLGVERRYAGKGPRAAGVSRTALVFVAPGMVAIAIFFLVPAVRGLLFAFQDVGPDQPLLGAWVGLANFRRVLASPSMGAALCNTLVYTAVVVPLNVGSALVLAAILAELPSGVRTFFKGAFYLPGVASVVVMAMVWRWLLDANFGLINRLIAPAGGGATFQVAANVLAVSPHLGRIIVGLGAPLLVWALASLALERLEPDPFRRERRRTLLGRCCGVLVVGGLIVGLAPVPFGHQPVEPFHWLTSTKLAMVSIMMTTVLRGPGGAMIVYLAALAGMPRELKEAARVDGAGPLQTFWYVTVPALRATTLYLVVTETIDSVQVFAQVLLLTDGGPADASVVLVHKMYTLAFRDIDFGGASALALLMMLALMALSLVQFRLLGRKGIGA